ncbi:MAG: DUF2339 domain-containing protein [Campylobacteraceae bacterium]|jgi:uncharacterized membrane protein|nr:DUF2339 domain-containing protein [Campylobacteraceae bacterium]
MEGLLVVLAIALIIVPVIALVKVSDLAGEVRVLRRKVEALQNSLKDILAQNQKSELNAAPPEVSKSQPQKLKTFAFSDTSDYKIISKQEPQPAPKKSETNEVINKILFWLTQNLVAKIAVLILFFGVSFLLKYGIDHGLLSPEIRVLGSLILGFVLFGIGWRFRKAKALYSLILQGGGIGVLYLSVFAAFKLYALIPVAAAFILLIVICALSVYFAILQNAVSLAILAFVGAYLTPILLSSGKGEHIILFSYYTIVSLALVLISRWRSWRFLNLIGFAFTVVTTALWYAKSYRADFYIETQLFIVANLLIFGVLAVLLFIRQERESVYHNAIDVVLLFGVPIFSYTLEYYILLYFSFFYASAFAALAFGLFYITGAFLLFKKFKDIAVKAAFYMLGIGIGFATLAVPLAFDDDLTSLIWLFEGSAIAWAALKNTQYKLGLFGLLITTFGALLLIYQYEFLLYGVSHISAFVVPYGFMGAVLFFNACLFYRHKNLHANLEIVSYILLIFAAISWVYWAAKAFDEVRSLDIRLSCIMVTFVVAGWFWYFVGRRMKWEALEYALVSLWGALFVVNICAFSIEWSYGALLFDASAAAAIASAYMYLYKGTSLKQFHKNIEPALYISLFWMVLIWIYNNFDILSDRFIYHQSYYNWVLFNAVFGFVILAVYIFQKKRLFPFERFSSVHWLIGLAPVVLYLVVKLFIALLIEHTLYLQYIPILNPLEIGVIFTLIVLKFYLDLTLRKYYQQFAQVAYLLFAVICFLQLNSIILRALSYYLYIPWSFYSLWNNEVTQSFFSIVWTLLSLALIIFANRDKNRNIWYVGMALLSIVIIKLVFRDSVELEGLFRAFVFIGVALLMLVIGFLAPIPPRENKKEEIKDV